MVTARDRETWNSQKLAVLEHLQAGRSITQDEAREQFGIMRLASRIDGLRSSRFKAWLAAKYFDAMQEEPKGADIEGALLLLAATAEFSPPRKLHTRIGSIGGKYAWRDL